MSLTADHKALVFLGAVALIGASVRLARVSQRGDSVIGGQPALDRQLGAAESSAQAGRRKAQPKRRSTSRRGATRNRSESEPVTSGLGLVPSGPRQPGSARFQDKLDLDVASAAQIESLPGIGPTLAGRIVGDRAARGPYGGLQGLR